MMHPKAAARPVTERRRRPHPRSRGGYLLPNLPNVGDARRYPPGIGFGALGGGRSRLGAAWCFPGGRSVRVREGVVEDTCAGVGCHGGSGSATSAGLVTFLTVRSCHETEGGPHERYPFRVYGRSCQGGRDRQEVCRHLRPAHPDRRPPDGRGGEGPRLTAANTVSAVHRGRHGPERAHPSGCAAVAAQHFR